ncbi:uncharacterized protein LOC130123376 [Lampris incognitus]|uniref:uncharacterized protein LOC130123376 n=1 Tax=Lampris incognitus TaxID=2546036 RepID=UPI0024B4B3B8|nr:uncharacterized protein LOC130123376 [Lampris incognitus]
MSRTDLLRSFVIERLTAAAEEIVGAFERTIAEYEEERERQRRLLDMVLKPGITIHRIDATTSATLEEPASLEGSSALTAAPESPVRAPTAWVLIQKLKNKILVLEKENKMLKDERDFLRQALISAQPAPAPGSTVLHHTAKVQPLKAKEKRRRREESESTEGSESDLGCSSDSSDSKEGKKKKKKSRKSSSPDKGQFGRRVTTPNEVTNRYKAVFSHYQRHLSFTMACNKLSVSKETIKMTAIIAEVDMFVPLDKKPPYKNGEPLAGYAKTCKAFLEQNQDIAQDLEARRKRKELLPLKYKFNK